MREKNQVVPDEMLSKEFLSRPLKRLLSTSIQ